MLSQTESIVRLSASTEAIVAALPVLGGLYFQARNRGGGLGKRISHLEPIAVEGLDFAFDADNGIGFAADEILAVHAGSIEANGPRVPAIDFEFDGFPAGMSLHELPGMCEEGAIAKFVDLFGGPKLDEDSLDDWRRKISPNDAMCDCCRERAEARTNAVADHPLYSIFLHAAQDRTKLECRLLSDHVDATSSFTPKFVSPSGGVLVVTNEECDHALHVNMRLVHAITIDRVAFDSVDYAVLRIFDMYGNLNFQFMTEDTVCASTWRWLCEARANSA